MKAKVMRVITQGTKGGNYNTSQKGMCKIENLQERFDLKVDAYEGRGHDYKERELCLITITMPDGNVWQGTIQDFMTIPRVLMHAMNALPPVPEEDNESDMAHTRRELDHVLKMFATSSGDVIIPDDLKLLREPLDTEITIATPNVLAPHDKITGFHIAPIKVERNSIDPEDVEIVRIDDDKEADYFGIYAELYNESHAEWLFDLPTRDKAEEMIAMLNVILERYTPTPHMVKVALSSKASEIFSEDATKWEELKKLSDGNIDYEVMEKIFGTRKEAEAYVDGIGIGDGYGQPTTLIEEIKG